MLAHLYAGKGFKGYALIDGSGHIAWHYRTKDYPFGAARRTNGNTLIAFGMAKGRNGSSGPTEAYEVTPAGAVTWHLVVDGGMTLFRVEPISSFEP